MEGTAAAMAGDSVALGDSSAEKGEQAQTGVKDGDAAGMAEGVPGGGVGSWQSQRSTPGFHPLLLFVVCIPSMVAMCV